jgi:hypothetical protein
MSESKYSPAVNRPEAVPGRTESIMCLFFPTTQHIACRLDALLLRQADDSQIALGYMDGEKFLPVAFFPGTISGVPEEKKVVIA